MTLAWGFFLLFSAYVSCANIQSKIMKELGFSNLGFIMLSLSYLFFCTTAMFAAPINKKLGTKWTLVISSLAYVCIIASFIIPCYKFEKLKRNEDVSSFIYSDSIIKFLCLSSAFIIGMGAGPLWVS